MIHAAASVTGVFLLFRSLNISTKLTLDYEHLWRVKKMLLPLNMWLIKMSFHNVF